MEHLPVSATLAQYEAQASEVFRGHLAGDTEILRLIHQNHPRFLDTEVVWKPLPLSSEDIRSSAIDAGDARLALARWYSFRDWSALEQTVNAIQAREPRVYDFEMAAEAVVTGNCEELSGILERDPDLVRARSARILAHDPPVHRATLLHYIAANGVEGYRQRTPANAVAIAEILLKAGADPDALADMYGGECTTLSMLVSSSPPAEAGLQVPLAETLLDHGADPNGTGTGTWVSPIRTALAFGFLPAANTLARRGAWLDSVDIVAGLGRASDTAALLPSAHPEERHRALALAAQLGHVDVVRILLDAGESPDRYNPEGVHSHSTPLHQAALAGHIAVVRLLVERGARLDMRDKVWNGTPLGWAEYEGREDVAEYLRGSERA